MKASTGQNAGDALTSKLMDEQKVFVGVAHFINQMATSCGITSVSNSALLSAGCNSLRKMSPLAVYPHRAVELMEGKSVAETEHLFTIFLSHCFICLCLL